MPINSRREALSRINFGNLDCPNSGLWFDKYLLNHENSETTYKTLISDTAEASAAARPAYEAFFRRWENSLKTIGAKTQTVTTTGRIALGLGNANPIENGTSLHRIYGVPFIPGSSLKGMVRHFAQQFLGDEWNPNKEAGKEAQYTQQLFGTTKAAGEVTFFDAYPVPSSGWQLHSDIMTPHHRDYYSGTKNAFPADWDDPTPIPLITFSGTFLIALRSTDKDSAWAKAGQTILEMALNESGIGGKTSSGYGRMKII